VRLDGLTIEVSVSIIEASFPTYAAANGNGLDGDGWAEGTGTTEAYAYGVRLGDGDNTIQSNDMRILAEAIADINGASDGDVFGASRGFITANASAQAVGIELGVGNDAVWNTGTLSVTATPSAQAFTEVHAGDGLCIWFFGWWCIAGGDGQAEATANFTANAAGILAGDGDNSITNDGSIIVTAAPNVAADIRRDSEYAAGSAGDNTRGPIHTVNSDSTAIGILTGDDNDIVINNGDIIVKAMDILSGCDDENGDCGVSISDQGTLSAIAIQTGAGDDILVNNGSIAAYTYRDGNASSAIGVDLGIGNDALTLGDQSEIIGSVDLGLGDDSLTLIGTPVVWDGIDTLFELPGGEGTDSLFLIGDGFYAGLLSSFEIATKSGAGTYVLPQLATLDSLTIDEGTLELGSSYSFAVDGEFYSYLHSEGDSGLLSIIGNSILDGAINIERRGDTFITNGTRYTVVTTTDGVGNSFNDITLPEPMPLLSFALEQTLDGVDIVATAESFAFTANNKLHRFVASNLNSIADDAVGDFNVQLGTIQRMASGFDVAFASLAPDAFQALTANTISTAHETTQLLRHHLSDARAVGRGEKSLAAAYEPVAMSYDGMLAQVARNSATSAIDMPQTQHQIESASSAVPGYRPSKWLTWMDAFSGSGDSDLVDGYTQYEHDASGFSIGLDRMLDNDLIIGLTIGFSDTDLSLQEAVADAAIESWNSTLYATKYSDRAYVEGGLYFANQTIDIERHLTIDSLERTATSRHDGETFMAFLSGGYRFDFDRWYLEPYGSLFYFDISEESFEEAGADNLNQILSKKSSNAMIGEIGTKFVRLQATSNGMIDWHASVAYNHDFGIDDMQIDYAYLGDPDAFFTIPDRNITSGSSVFGAGIAYIRGRSTFGLEYRGQYNSQYNSQIIGVRLAYEF
jgi:outer membrane autotransporter protein